MNTRAENGYPLIIEAEEVILEESPVDRELLTRLLPKLNYPAILEASKQLAPHCDADALPDLPEQLPEELDDALAANLHRVLFDIHMIEGNLVCPDTGRKFPVKEGIPNMILHEDEL